MSAAPATPPQSPAMTLVSKSNRPVWLAYVPARLDDLGLGVHAYRAYMRIARRWNPDEGFFESASRASKACRMKADTWWTAVRELEDRGLVRRTPRDGQSTRFDLLPPTGWDAGTEAAQHTDLPPDSGQVGDRDPPPETGEGVPPETGEGVPPETGYIRKPPEGEPLKEGTRRGRAREDAGATCTGSGQDLLASDLHVQTVARLGEHDDSPAAGQALFDAFWQAYPKRHKKRDARRAWDGLLPSQALAAHLIRDVQRRARSDPDWQRDSRRYVPLPANYLADERWTDEQPDAPTPDPTYADAFAANRAAARAALGLEP